MKRNVLIVACLLASVRMMAETPMEVDSLIHLNSLVVSANKIEVNRNSVPLTISVIDRNQIETVVNRLYCQSCRSRFLDFL